MLDAEKGAPDKPEGLLDEVVEQDDDEEVLDDEEGVPVIFKGAGQ